MTPAETERVVELLRSKQATLLRWLHKRDEITIERASDSLDQVQLMGERELAIRNLDRDSHMARLIQRALLRLEAGSYGTCLNCEEPIVAKRMLAVPWAEFCIPCQEGVDRGEIEGDAASREIFTNAA